MTNGNEFPPEWHLDDLINKKIGLWEWQDLHTGLTFADIACYETGYSKRCSSCEYSREIDFGDPVNPRLKGTYAHPMWCTNHNIKNNDGSRIGRDHQTDAEWGSGCNAWTWKLEKYRNSGQMQLFKEDE